MGNIHGDFGAGLQPRKLSPDLVVCSGVGAGRDSPLKRVQVAPSLSRGLYVLAHHHVQLQ